MDNHTDASWCKNLIMTLTKTAQKWVQSLPDGSISCLNELAVKFKSYFSSRTSRTKQTIKMMTIRKGKDESLRKYFSRFDIECLQVLNLEENILTFAFRQGLNSKRHESEVLKFSNQQTYLKTMKKVIEYAQSHVDIEVKDFKAFTRSIHQEQKGKSCIKTRKPAEMNDRGKKLVRTEDLDVLGLHNYTNYTTLKESKPKIFNLYKDDTKLQLPIQRKLVGKNPEVYCKFYECPGHWTEHCKS